MTPPVPPGTPAVPIPARIDIRTTWICCGTPSESPKNCARKSTVTPSKSAVPFWLPVDPRVSTKPEISRGTPSRSSVTRSAVGSVALLELVENATIMISRILRKKVTGFMRAKTRIRIEYTPNWWSARPSSTTPTYLARTTMMSNPSRAATEKMSAATP